MSLKNRLILLGISVVIIPFCMAGGIIYLQLSRHLLDIAVDNSLHFVKGKSLFVDTTLSQELRLVKLISSNPEILKACKTGDFKIAREHIRAMHDGIGKDYFSIFILDQYGIARAEAVFDKQTGLNLSDRPYFKQAKLGKTAITGPFKARGTTTPGAPIIVISTPVRENDRFYGMVAMVFSTDFLINILSMEKKGETSYAYIIDEKGLVLAHPNKEYILEMNLLKQPENEIIRQIIQEKVSTSVRFRFKGVEKIIGASTVKHTGWKVIFSQDRDEIMAPMNKILSAVLITALIVLMILIPIIAVFWGKISNPIQTMMDSMRTVTHHSNECILQISLDRKIMFANPAFLTATGQALKDVLHREASMLYSNQTDCQDIWSCIETGNTWSGELTYDKAGDEPIVFDTILLPLKDAGGANQSYFGIGRDITEELKYKKRLQQTHRLEAIGRLAGGIAHDFNNILTGIYGYAQLSLSKDLSRSDIERYLGRIIKGADRASDLVSQILVFSSQKEVDMQPLSPKFVIKEALKLLRASIPTAINIETNFVSDAKILAEPTQIHQIVMNLFTNAAHAIGHHTGLIKLDLEDFYVDEAFTKTHPEIETGKHLMLRISDTGNGMEPKTLDHIFDPFFTTKNQDEGTGLGLSVVHGIVKKMNGIITVYSEFGRGAVFNIILPCTKTDGNKPSQKQVILQKGTESIVFVDDDPAIVETMQIILTSLGYKVTVFTDAISALDNIQKAPDEFELLITDYSMPKMTGPDLAMNLKALGINIPIILISGYYSSEMEEAVQDLEIFQLLRKPINTNQLADAIRNSFKKKDNVRSPT